MELDLEYAAHFEEFLFDWNHKIYLAIGSYGSGKSHETAIKIIYKLMEEKRRCAVIREVYETHLESTYKLLQEVAEVVDPNGKYIKFAKSPLAVNFSNGSKIIFKGADKTTKMKGLQSVDLVWVEEASEVKYAAYKEMLLRLRTQNNSLHIILATNPVSEDNWIYKHFFIDEEKDITHLNPETMYSERVVKMDDLFIHHSTVDDNPFVPESYVKELDKMEIYDPELFLVARKGRFGVLGEKVFNNVHKDTLDNIKASLNATYRPMYFNGCDLGFVTSYNAFIQCAVDHKNKTLYIYNEYYNRGESDAELAKALSSYKNEIITFDSAEPKTISYMRQKGFKALGAKKGAGSVKDGIRKLKRFERIVISDTCKNAYRDFSTLTYAKNKKDEVDEDKLSFDAHCLDSVRYAIESYDVGVLKGRSAKGAM